MRSMLILLTTATLFGCSTYKGSEIWRRSTCESIVDADERAQCLQDAIQPEKEYKRDVEEVTGDRDIT